jgi:membrane protease YdiL (CAAX protease family)
MTSVGQEFLPMTGESKSGEARPESARRLIAYAVGWLALGFFAAILFSALTTVAFGLLSIKTNPNIRNLDATMTMLAFSIVMFVATIIRGRVVGDGNVRAGLCYGPISRPLTVTILAIAITGYALFLIDVYAGDNAHIDIRLLSAHPWLTGGVVVLIGAYIGFFGPLSEEFFFRGWLWTGLERQWGVFPAAFFTGASWLALHLDRGLAELLILVPVALLLAMARHLGSSVRAPLALHMLYNTILIAPPALQLLKG